MIYKYYCFLNYLSIDIVIGTVILSKFISNYQYHVELSWQVYTLLGCVVWLIYTIDHLKDSFQLPNSQRGRYQFHAVYRKSILFSLFVVSAFIFILLFFVPKSIFIWGGTLSIVTLVYLFSSKKLSKIALKELFIALIFTFGILVGPIAVSENFFMVSFLLMFLVAFVNLTIFSWLELDIDKKEKIYSIATFFHPDKLKYFLLFILLIIFSMVIFVKISNILSVYFAISASVYVLIILCKDWFLINERYRKMGDGVFILPIVTFF